MRSSFVLSIALILALISIVTATENKSINLEAKNIKDALSKISILELKEID